MIEHLAQYVIPAAYALLPPAMASPAATAFLLAISLQESGAEHRRQVNGSARGFWQFERNGVRAILTHPRSEFHLTRATKALCYLPTVERIQAVIEHNDTLAAVCARLSLWTLPDALPTRDNAVGAWQQYLESWRPGAAKKDPKPHFKRWMENYPRAWNLVDPRSPHSMETP